MSVRPLSFLSRVPGEYRGVALIGFLVFASTTYVACGGAEERTFGNGSGTGGSANTGGAGGASSGGADSSTSGGASNGGNGGTGGSTGGTAGTGGTGTDSSVDGDADDGPISNAG